MNFYFSTGAYYSRDLYDIISQSNELNFNIELSSSVTCSAADLIGTLQTENRPGRFLLHNYFPPPKSHFVLNLASTNEHLLKKSFIFCRQAIDICAKLDIPFYSVHAGSAMDLYPGDLGNPIAQQARARQQKIPRKAAYDIFVSTIVDLAEYARSKGVGLLIENNVVAMENIETNGDYPILLASTSEIYQFFLDAKESGVRFLLDTGHAKVSARTLGERPEKFFEILGHLIGALHLNENDGIRDNHERFDKDAWFASFLSDYRNRPMVIESNRLTAWQMQQQHNILTDIVR